MIYPLVAIVLLWLLLSRSHAFARFQALMMPRLSERFGAVAAVVAALIVLVRGNVWAALVFFGAALWLLGRSTRIGQGRASRPSAAVSRVRSAVIEMDYDHRSSSMYGRVIAGPDEGTPLEHLTRQQCEAVYALCRRDDPEGACLLEAYFDRRFAGWRPAGQGHRDAGERRARASGRMSEDEAYQILGLRRGATRDDIVRSHRTVMKKWHPDQGGTADLAARANEAKEVLLRRHV